LAISQNIGKLDEKQKDTAAWARYSELTGKILHGLNLSARSYRRNPNNNGEYQVRAFCVEGSFSS